jgi:hypothetical protein
MQTGVSVWLEATNENLEGGSYDHTITLAIVYTILDVLVFLVLVLGSYSSYRSPLFRLSLRRLRFRFFD